MYIFADSGSTKTNWLITNPEGEIISGFQTIGLNPYFVSKERILQAIGEQFPSGIDSLLIKKVFFYGSGCSSLDNHEHLRFALEDYFFNAKIQIFSDMLGTARAIFKNSEGIAAIIGTGTNSCLYNGSSISQSAISLGYILGDEGSGAYIGKIFAKMYLEKRFDKELNRKILDETGATHSSILSAIYQNPHPNRYLAEFCIFIKNHIDHPQLQEIVKVSFDRFFEKYIKIYSNFNSLPLGFCGSVALNFKDFINDIAIKYEMKDLIFINKPLEGLIEYHKLNKFE
jgi:N-acetylglucosamine kinase-like BadF-type ATPase